MTDRAAKAKAYLERLARARGHRRFAAELRLGQHDLYLDHAADALRSRRRCGRQARRAHLVTNPHERRRLLALLDRIAELYGYDDAEALVAHVDELAAALAEDEREPVVVEVPPPIEDLDESISRHAPPARALPTSPTIEGRAAA